MEWVTRGQKDKQVRPSWLFVVFLIFLLLGVLYGVGWESQVVQAQSTVEAPRMELVEMQKRQTEALEKIADELRRIRMDLRKHGGKM